MTEGHAQLTVDLRAVAENTAKIRARTDAELMAVVKADGFGHGAVAVARAALGAGATRLGVTSLAEAVELRTAGFREPILSWLNVPGADFVTARELGIEVAVADRTMLDQVVAAGGIGVHLHLDTGMCRDGAHPDTWTDLCTAARAAELAGRIRVTGVMSHLSMADEPHHVTNTESVKRFRHGVLAARRAGLRPLHLHLASTAATLTNSSTHFTMVRVGAGLVGIDPTRSNGLRGAMTLTAPLVNTQTVEAGTPVGYRHTWRAPRRTTLGLIPLGYADGLPRSASNRAEVWLRGRRRPVAGLISMDQTIIDLGDEPAWVGETVTVLGPGDRGEPTVADWAAWASTIEHEIVTGIGKRVRRHIINADETNQEEHHEYRT